MVGRENTDEGIDRREVVAEGGTNAPHRRGVNLLAEGDGRRTERAIRRVTHGAGGTVRTTHGGSAARADTGGGGVAVVAVATPPDVSTHEGGEGEQQAGKDGNGEGTRGSPDARSVNNNDAGCHSTSNGPSAGRSTSGATDERGDKRCTTTSVLSTPTPTLADALAGKDVLAWTAADVRVWLRALPRGLAAFTEAAAFSGGSVDGKRLAALTLADLKKKEFHHAKFRAKVCMKSCAVETGHGMIVR